MKKSIVLIFLFCIESIIFAQEKIKSISASSTLAENNKSPDFYAPQNLIDGKWNSWVEGQNDNGVGSVITIELEKPVTVYSLRIRNGYGDLRWYRQNNRVKNIDIILNDEYTYSTILEDTYEFQDVSTYKYTNESYSKPVKTIKLKIKSVYKGSAYNDTCLSEIIVNPSHMPEKVLMDPYSNELFLKYLLQIKKVPEARIADDGEIEYLYVPTDFDLSIEPDMEPYWSRNFNKLPRNIFAALFDEPFAIEESDFVSAWDPVYCRRIDVYTYKNGSWVLDNDNKKYEPFMKYVKSARQKDGVMAFHLGANGYGVPTKYFAISDGTRSRTFQYWTELKEVDEDVF